MGVSIVRNQTWYSGIGITWCNKRVCHFLLFPSFLLFCFTCLFSKKGNKTLFSVIRVTSETFVFGFPSVLGYKQLAQDLITYKFHPHTRRQLIGPESTNRMYLIMYLYVSTRSIASMRNNYNFSSARACEITIIKIIELFHLIL